VNKEISVYNKLYDVVRRNLFVLGVVAVLSILVAFLNVYLIKFEKEITDAAILKNKGLFKGLLIGVLVIICLKIPVEYIKAYLFGKFAEKTLMDLRIEISKKLIFSPINFIEKNAAGDFISRLTSDISIVAGFFTSALDQLLYHPVVFIIGLIYAIHLNWKMTLISFAIIPITILIAFIISKPVERFTKKQQDLYGNTNAIFQDIISGISVIKVFKLERYFYKKFENSLLKSFSEGLKSAKVETLLEPVKTIIQLGPVLLVILTGGAMVMKKQLTFGGLMAFIELMNIFIAPMNILPNIINSYRKAAAASKRLNEILSQYLEESGSEKGFDEYEYAVEFEDVWFSYENDLEKAVLKNFNLKIKRGEKIAFVGSSGCGKSTIVKLILGMYKPQKGCVKVFGIPTSRWNLYSLREKISVVNQDIYLFPDTIFENIKYGRYSATYEEIIEAARKSEIHEFIMSLPRGFETELKEGSVNVSGGQRQRIAIARAILRSSDVYIFDEATSALDADSENNILKTLNNSLKGKTIITIAHRFSSIKNVDRIIVIDRGTVAEEGSHDDLLCKKGIYYQLYTAQLMNELV